MAKKTKEVVVEAVPAKTPAVVSVERNGDAVTVLHKGEAVFGLSLAALTDDVRDAALFHGIKQKLVDAAAMSRNTETGMPASPADKIAAVIAIAERLQAGHWNRPAGEAAATGGILVTALCVLYPAKTRADIVAFVGGKTKAEQAALRASPKVAPIIANIQAQAGKGIDSEALLGGLE